MKKLLSCFALLVLLTASARAGVILGTSNPSGNPLVVTAGTTSGPMLVNVVSNNPPNDVMAAWQFSLVIVPEAGATGTLTFKDPTAGTAPNPPNYIFDSHGLGISVPSNTGSRLDPVNDFDLNLGTVVPGATGANLLQMDFLASSNASGLFDIRAVEGAVNTVWTDSGGATQFFANVPDGTGTALIGVVRVTPAVTPPAVPEPSTLALFGLGGAAVAGWRWRRRKRGGALKGRAAPLP